MRAVRVVPVVATALGLLAAVMVAGCTGSSAPVATTSSQPASLAASASTASASTASASPAAAPPGTASAPAATSSAAPSPSSAVQNLIVSTAVRGDLLAAYAAFRKIPASDAKGLPGSVYYAYVPATGTYWAKATWEPASGDTQTVEVGFQDGGSDGFYKRAGNGPWQVILGGEPEVCEELKFFPLPVLAAWSLPTSATPASMC
jgi:hypothetical protein